MKALRQVQVTGKPEGLALIESGLDSRLCLRHYQPVELEQEPEQEESRAYLSYLIQPGLERPDQLILPKVRLDPIPAKSGQG